MDYLGGEVPVEGDGKKKKRKTAAAAFPGLEMYLDPTSQSVVTQSTGKTYICDHCGRRFLCKSHLQDHARLHTGEKPFACEICGKSFAQKSNMRVHMYIHRPKTPKT